MDFSLPRRQAGEGARAESLFSPAFPAGFGQPAWVRTVRTLVAVDAVLALRAGLTGCPAEALSTHTHARAIDSVQTDPVPKADVLGFSWAGLALGTKVARTAFSRLKQKDQAGLGQGHTSILWFCPAMVRTSCRWDWMCVRSFDPSWRGWEGWGEQPPENQVRLCNFQACQEQRGGFCRGGRKEGKEKGKQGERTKKSEKEGGAAGTK